MDRKVCSNLLSPGSIIRDRVSKHGERLKKKKRHPPMLDPYCTHKKGMMGVGVGLRTACVGDEEVLSGTVGLCDACMCTGLNQQLYQESLLL